MTEEEVGIYECRDVDGRIRRFKLELIEENEQTEVAQPDDAAQIFPAQLNGQIVLACGADPKEKVQWNKLDGVNKYLYYFHLFGRN